jgi:PAS domain S-box-containing protein
LPDGNIMVIGKDITEILNQKEALENTAKRFDLATHAADLGVWEFDLLNKRHTWNDRMNELYEYEKSASQITLSEWLSSIHPDDRSMIELEIQTAVQNGSEFSHTFRIINKTGKIKHIESSGIVVYQKGVPVKMIGINRDISERFESEEKIRKSNELYELVAMATNDLVWDWDVKTNKINRIEYGLQKVLGFNDNSLIDQPELYDERIHPDDRLEILDFKEKIFTDKSFNRFKIEYRFLKLDDQYVYIQDNGYVIRDENGVPERIIGASWDLTESKNAEAAVLQSEEKYRSLIQQASDSILIYSFQGEILDCNEAALIKSGYSREELLRLPVLELIREDDTKKNPIRFEDLKNGDHVISERQILTKVGGVIPMEINSKMMPDGNIMAIARDITERKKAEEDMQKLISLVETSNDIIGISNLDGNPIFINKSGRDILEMDESEELSKFHFTDFFHPEDISWSINQLVPVFVENKKWTGEVSLRSLKTHKKVPVLASIFVIRDKETGKAIAIGNVSYNISERKKAESEMRELNEQLRTLTVHLENVREEERKEMAREIHDELGQQLTGLKMQVGMLAKKIEPEFEEVQEQLVDIQELVAQMVGSVKRIIFNLRPHILDDFGIVATMDSFANEFEKRYNIKTTFISSHDDLKLDAGISIELFRIFQESLTNIAKHADAKNVVTTFNYNDKNCIMAITDDGVGFDLEDSNNSYGLMGMKERAIKLDADFNIESKPGSGTVITVTVPL